MRVDPLSEERPGLETAREGVRIIGGVIGLAAIVLGLVVAAQLFVAVKNALTDPQGLEPLIDRWSQTVGDGDLVLRIADEDVALGRLIAIAVLGFGTLLLTRIALAIVSTGARVVSWTLSDLEAMKRLVGQVTAQGARSAGSKPG